MTFMEAIKEIESNEFAVRVNLASDFNVFLSILQEQEPVQALLKDMACDEKIRGVLKQCLILSIREVDERYENPWDAAMTAYLWLIGQKDLKLAEFAASHIAKSVNTWWSKKLSHQILLKGITKTISDKKKEEITTSAFHYVILGEKTDSLEVIISPRILTNKDLDNIWFPPYDTLIASSSVESPTIIINWLQGSPHQIDYNIHGQSWDALKSD